MSEQIDAEELNQDNLKQYQINLKSKFLCYIISYNSHIFITKRLLNKVTVSLYNIFISFYYLFST